MFVSVFIVLSFILIVLFIFVMLKFIYYVTVTIVLIISLVFFFLFSVVAGTLKDSTSSLLLMSFTKCIHIQWLRLHDYAFKFIFLNSVAIFMLLYNIWLIICLLICCNVTSCETVSFLSLILQACTKYRMAIYMHGCYVIGSKLVLFFKTIGI